MRSSSSAVIFGAVYVAACATSAQAQTPQPAPRSTCTGTTCPRFTWTELFVSAFLAAGNFRGLSTSLLATAEEAKVAFVGIDQTRLEVEAGRMTLGEGEAIVKRHKAEIRRFLQKMEDQAIEIAASGQVARLPQIDALVSLLLYVARQDALQDREDVAVDAQRALARVLVAFSERFAATCHEQTFPAELALSLERQNQLLDTGVSVVHCARRRVTADMSRQGVNYHLETCAYDDWDDWELTITGAVTGKGKVVEQVWELETVYQGNTTGAMGLLTVYPVLLDPKPSKMIMPDDAGPNARPNGNAAAPVPAVAVRRVAKIDRVSISTIKLIGKEGYSGWTLNDPVWATGDLVISDKPCTVKKNVER